MMHVLRKTTLTLAMILIAAVIAACGGGGGGEADGESPEAAVRGFFEAANDNDVDRGLNVVCQAMRDQVEDTSNSEAADFDLSDLEFEVVDETDTSATVMLTGTLGIDGEDIPAGLVFGDGIPVVKEGDDWKFCLDLGT